MITANELRLGNLIYHIPDEETKLTYHITEAVEIDAVSENELYEPIPLTPEVLEGCGFRTYPEDAKELEIDIDYYELPVNDGKITQYPDGKFYVSAQYQPDFYGAEAKIEYLHQLQNLYYALTGQELKVKEPV